MSTHIFHNKVLWLFIETVGGEDETRRKKSQRLQWEKKEKQQKQNHVKFSIHI